MTLNQYLDELDSHGIKSYVMCLRFEWIKIIYSSGFPRNRIEHWLNYRVYDEEISGNLQAIIGMPDTCVTIDVMLEG